MVGDRAVFYALDDDNTGAMEAPEFLLGLRRLLIVHDHNERWTNERMTFAFNLFDKDRGNFVEQEEIRDFLRSFYTVAREVAEGWTDMFENMFGVDVAVVVQARTPRPVAQGSQLSRTPSV